MYRRFRKKEAASRYYTGLTSQLYLQRVKFLTSNLGFHPKLHLENLSPLLQQCFDYLYLFEYYKLNTYYEYRPRTTYILTLLEDTAILIKNLETPVSFSASPVLMWVSQWSQCFKIRVAPHWEGRRDISVRETV